MKPEWAINCHFVLTMDREARLITAMFMVSKACDGYGSALSAHEVMMPKTGLPKMSRGACQPMKKIHA